MLISEWVGQEYSFTCCAESFLPAFSWAKREVAKMENAAINNILIDFILEHFDITEIKKAI